MRRLLRVTVMLTAVGGALLIALAGRVLTVLFGSDYAAASSAVPPLVLAALAAAVWKITGAEVVALGDTRPRLWSGLAGLLTMLAVDVIAVPALGIEGAGLGAACGYGVAALLVARARRTLRRRFDTGGRVDEVMAVGTPEVGPEHSLTVAHDVSRLPERLAR